MNITRIITVALLLLTISSRAQKAGGGAEGVVKGVVMDSARNYVLRSATLSIYRVGDAALIAYTLSNNFGQFSISKLPVGDSLELVVSYIGYKKYAHRFTITPDRKELAIPGINLERSSGNLEDVVVTATRKPPVQMNGDTLEFNADAFVLDSNAVVEDLFRKLPGVTLWGDGTITVNGKKVSNVFVDGKPFFGGDKRVATQNIPKDAVDKIQVYRQKAGQSQVDSITEINIKLKKNKQRGIFGKAGVGYGTSATKEVEVNLNQFSPHTQLSLVTAGNNVNKIADNANVLLANASYKGVGASLEYQPDFRREGETKFMALGLLLQEDFAGNSTANRKNLLSADIFSNKVDAGIKKNLLTATVPVGDSGFIQQAHTTLNSEAIDHKLKAKYEWKEGSRSLYILPSVGIRDYSYKSEEETASRSLNAYRLSNLYTRLDKDELAREVNTDIGYSWQPGEDRGRLLPSVIELNYALHVSSEEIDMTKLNDFLSWIDTSQNRSLNRMYSNKSRRLGQGFVLKMGDVQKIIFGTGNLIGITIGLGNSVSFNRVRDNDHVYDFDKVKGEYMVNSYLTNINSYNTITEVPSVNLKRVFSNTLANRFEKLLAVEVSLKHEFYRQENISQKDFLSFRRTYSNFIPYAGIQYSNNQLGDFQTVYSLKYQSSMNYPEAYQLAPLVDSSDVYAIRGANAGLREEYKREISFDVLHNSLRAKNPFNYFLNISGGKVRNKIVDSSRYDDLGRNFLYTANKGQQYYGSFRGELKKSFKVSMSHQLQLSVNAQARLTGTPGYINGVSYTYRSLVMSSLLGVNYSFSDRVVVNAEQGVMLYSARQSGFSSSKFSNSQFFSKLSTSVNCTRYLSVSSNISYNRNLSSGSDAIHFSVWNAVLTYRFLKQRNGELRFSALDLLHQNRGILNYGSVNSLSLGNVNVLQQYFIVGFSYFPRKFGRKDTVVAK